MSATTKRSVYRWENGGWVIVLSDVFWKRAERFMWENRNDGHRYRMGA